MNPYIPTLAQISREMITVIVAAIAAALLLSQLPAVRQWIRDQFVAAGVSPPSWLN
jgi:hypothetical protein